MNKNDAQNSLQFRHDGMGSKCLLDFAYPGKQQYIDSDTSENQEKEKQGVNLCLRGFHSMLWERLSAPISKYPYLLVFKYPQSDKKRKQNVFTSLWQMTRQLAGIDISFCSSPSSSCIAKGSQRSVLGFPYLIHRSWKRRQHQHSNTVSKTLQFIPYPVSDLLQKLGKTFYSTLVPWCLRYGPANNWPGQRTKRMCLSLEEGQRTGTQNGTVSLLQGKLSSVHLKHSSILIKNESVLGCQGYINQIDWFLKSVTKLG